MISEVKKDILNQPQHMKKEPNSTNKNQNNVEVGTVSHKNDEKNHNAEATVHVYEEKERLLPGDASDGSYSELNLIMLLVTVILARIC